MSEGGNLSVDVQNEVEESREKKAEIPQKSRKVLDGKTNLYRYFGQRGDLIYVGISHSAIARMLDHAETSFWFDEVETVKIDRFKTRKSAMREEKRLIELCQPIHNVTHAKPVNRIRRRLIKQFGSLEAWSKHYRHRR